MILLHRDGIEWSLVHSSSISTKEIDDKPMSIETMSSDFEGSLSMIKLGKKNEIPYIYERKEEIKWGQKFPIN